MSVHYLDDSSKTPSSAFMIIQGARAIKFQMGRMLFYLDKGQITCIEYSSFYWTDLAMWEVANTSGLQSQWVKMPRKIKITWNNTKV